MLEKVLEILPQKEGYWVHKKASQTEAQLLAKQLNGILYYIIFAKYLSVKMSLCIVGQ